MALRPYIVGNWKMNKTASEAVRFARELTSALPKDPAVEIVLAPPFTALESVGTTLGSASHIALGLALIGGIAVLADRPFQVGDWVVVGDVEGTVEWVGFRSTRLRTFQGQIAIIPNAQVFQNPVENYSTGERRVDLRCGVAYGDDLEKARELAIDAISMATRMNFATPSAWVRKWAKPIGAVGSVMRSSTRN